VLSKDGMEYDMKVVDSRVEFDSELDAFKPDVVLSDHSLPGFSSFDALAIFNSKNLNIPFILVTGAVSEEYAVSILKSGADDYILKANLSKLPVAILSALKKHQTQAARKAAEAKLKLQNEELIKINEELDHFVYKSSHNLRAPLMSIKGLVNIQPKGTSI
jgi:DNA-binding response OmpR family regulator